MKRILANILLVSAFLVAVGPGPLDAATCNTRYRIWQDGNNTYYKHGEVILLDVGEKGDLYIHAYPSQSEHPFSASADIGAPTAFGIRGQRPQDVKRVLRLGTHDSRKGRISLTAVRAGATALGYQITAVVSPGRLEKVPRDCRIGQVRIKVQGADPEPPDDSPSSMPEVRSANDAAHQLIMELYTGILRRSEAEADDYPDNFFDQVLRGGLQGLTSIAETMTSSHEFRSAALSRTRQSLADSGVSTGSLSQGVLENQLLSDIFASLYDSEPYGDVRRRMASDLSACLSGRRGDEGACRNLGNDLLSQRLYSQSHRDLLRYWR